MPNAALLALFWIGQFEGGNAWPRNATLDVVRQALEQGGVEFLGDTGVQLRTKAAVP